MAGISLEQGTAQDFGRRELAPAVVRHNRSINIIDLFGLIRG